MDLTKYAAGKISGKASIVRHGASTVLVSLPDGFDPETGIERPPREQGFQLRDLEAAREAANAQVLAAEEALERAMEALNAVVELVDDAGTALGKK